MKNPRDAQKSVVIGALTGFSLVLLLLQLWLFVSVLEGQIVGHASMALPAAVASLVLLAVNLWMLKGVSKMEGGE